MSNDFFFLNKKLWEKMFCDNQNRGRFIMDQIESKFTKIYETNGWFGDESVSGGGSSMKQTEIIRVEIPKLIKKYEIELFIDAPCGDLHWMREVLSDCYFDKGMDFEYIGIDIVKDLIDKNKFLYEKKNITIPADRNVGDEWFKVPYDLIEHPFHMELMKRINFNKVSFRHSSIIDGDLPQIYNEFKIESKQCMIFVRDCLVHFSYSDIIKTINNFRKAGYKWLLTTSFPRRENRDIETGQWRPINFERQPFGLKPLETINEGCTENNGIYTDKSLVLFDLYDGV